MPADTPGAGDSSLEEELIRGGGEEDNDDDDGILADWIFDEVGTARRKSGWC